MAQPKPTPLLQETFQSLPFSQEKWLLPLLCSDLVCCAWFQESIWSFRVSLTVSLSPWIFCPPSLIQCHVYNRRSVDAWLKWENEQWVPHHSCWALSLSLPVPRCSLAVPGPLRDVCCSSGNRVCSVEKATQKGTFPTDLEIYKMLLLREKNVKRLCEPTPPFPNSCKLIRKLYSMHTFIYAF